MNFNRLITRLGFAAAAVIPLLTSAGSPPAPADAVQRVLNKVTNVVILYAENRSFDHLYGLFPGANGITQATPDTYRQVDRDGTILPSLPPVWKSDGTPDLNYPTNLPNQPFRIDQPPVNLPLTTATRDLVHRFYQNQEQINGGKLNRYAAVSDAGGLVMGYYDGSVLPLWKLAQQYTLADNFFMGAFGGSLLNHFWLICACPPTFANAPKSLIESLDANGQLRRRSTSPASARKGPPQYLSNGSVTPDGYAVNTLQPPYQPSGIPPAVAGEPTRADPALNPLPPQEQKTIGDTLSAKNVSWAWYAGSWTAAVVDGMQPPSRPRQIINPPDGGAPNFQPHHQPFNYFKRFAPGTPDRADHLQDETAFLAAIESGTLPQVAFYKPQGNWNEHPGYTDVLSGDQHLAQIAEKILASPQGKTTVILITYDENGGFWDHVAPPKVDRWGPGTRIPTLIVSPLVKKRNIDHTLLDTTSILKLITRKFDLEPLPGVRKEVGDLTSTLDPAALDPAPPPH